MNRNDNTARSKPERVTLGRGGLEVECFFSAGGKLIRKIERLDGAAFEFRHAFDGQGRLLEVTRNGVRTERYEYDRQGRRADCWRDTFCDLARGRLEYDGQGRLARAGDVTFAYDDRGALSERRDREGVTRHFYNGDTMPDEVILPDGTKIRYEYGKDNPIGPARRFRNGILTGEFRWLDPLRLGAFCDHGAGLEQTFVYDRRGALERIRLAPLKGSGENRAAAFGYMDALLAQGRRERMRRMLEQCGGGLDAYCGCDQAGSLRVLTDAWGRLIKEIRYDSFGLRRHDSFPDLFVPTGFAGGLTDPDTGFTRFGWRDYDPAVGRFTAPDPLGDTGGDHDPYEYCLDDPVSMCDPEGLIPLPLLLLAGKTLAVGLGLGGAYGAAKIADLAGSGRDERQSTAARDAVKAVAPKVAGAAAVSALPGAAVMAPGAVAAAGQRIGAVIHSSAHADKIIKGVTHAARFAEPCIVPGPPALFSLQSAIGGLASWLATEFQKRRNSEQ